MIVGVSKGRRLWLTSLAACVACLVFAGCGRGDRPHGDLNSVEYVPMVAERLVVFSPAFEDGGTLPAEFTCDGAGLSPPVSWRGAPAGTKSYALSLWHVSPDREFKSYWVVYNIPTDVTGLAKGAEGIGKTGYNGKRRADYDPMCSKRPGVKEYHLTVYALSAQPDFATDHVSRAELLEAMRPIALAEGTLDFKYER